MSFVPSAGYGNIFGYTAVNVRADGWEPKHFAGTVMRRAFSALVFTRFMNESRDAFGVGKGGTFTVPMVLDWGMPTSITPLTSGTAMTVGTQSWDSVTMSMFEYGTGIAYEKILDWFTSIPVRNELIISLSNWIARAVNLLDFQMYDACRFAIEVPATGSYTPFTWGTNRKGINQGTYGELGRGGLAQLYDGFKKNIVSPYDRGFYGLVSNSETLRNLKEGSVFQNAILYNDVNGIRFQVLGEYMGFFAVETEEQLTKGTSFAIANNSGGYGFGLMPNITFYPDFGQDAGRLPVWKVLFYRGQGPLYRDKGTAVVCIRSTTAAYSYGGLG